MRQKINLFLLCIIALMPNRIKCAYYRYICKATIHSGVWIGVSIIQARHIILEEDVRIGHFNIVTNLQRFHLAKKSRIDSWNIFNAVPLGSSQHFAQSTDRNPSFYLGEDSGIGTRHYFNCDDAITIGSFSAIAGRRSQFFTHGIDFEHNQQIARPIHIGDYSHIATSCLINRGITFPSRSVLGACSVLSKTFEQEYTLYAGVPAKPIKHYSENAQYFSRQSGLVG
jgi:hypothetical protein